MAYHSDLPEIRITGVSKKHIEELEAIAKAQGYSTMSLFWKHEILRIIGEPQKIILAPLPPTDETGEIRIQGINKNTITTLQYIAANMGFTTLKAFMKVKFKEIIENTSTRDKQPPD